METIEEYKKRYLLWLRIQKGKSISKETRSEVNREIIKIKQQLKELRNGKR